MTDIKTKMTLFLFIVSLAVVIGGCEEYPNPAVIEEQQAKLKNMKKTIRLYHDSNGQYPENISKIKKLMCSGVDSGMYRYNPENGTVRLKKR